MAGHIDCVVGARPNFMKIAPLLRALETPPAAASAWSIPVSTMTQ